MQEVASEFAREYNRRQGRMNAFWGDNFHATLVESGRYLWECLCYIELNMVRRAGVRHPIKSEARSPKGYRRSVPLSGWRAPCRTLRIRMVLESSLNENRTAYHLNRLRRARRTSA